MFQKNRTENRIWCVRIANDTLKFQFVQSHAIETVDRIGFAFTCSLGLSIFYLNIFLHRLCLVDCRLYIFSAHRMNIVVVAQQRFAQLQSEFQFQHKMDRFKLEFLEPQSHYEHTYPEITVCRLSILCTRAACIRLTYSV